MKSEMTRHARQNHQWITRWLQVINTCVLHLMHYMVSLIPQSAVKVLLVMSLNRYSLFIILILAC